MFVRSRCYHLVTKPKRNKRMRYSIPCFALAAASVLSLTAIAQPPDKDGKKADGKRAEMREKMLKEFDADKDGKLSDEERAKAREKMKALHGQKGGKRAPGARGPEGRRGPQPPNPDEVFDKFDKDKDGKLSKDEFRELTKAVHERMRRHIGPAGPSGRDGKSRPPGKRPKSAQFERRGFGRGGFGRGGGGGIPLSPRSMQRRFAGGPRYGHFERRHIAGPPHHRTARSFRRSADVARNLSRAICRPARPAPFRRTRLRALAI
jgi:hypothetical protein